MDPLTHIFLPLTIAYVLRGDLFGRSRYLLFCLFGLVPDIDKLIGVPGLFHSLVALIPFCLVIVVVRYRNEPRATYGVLASVFVFSHLLLDFLEGVTVPLLYPIVETGVGLTYPGTIVFGPGAGPLWIAFDGLPIALTVGQLRTGHADAAVSANTFGFLNGFGIAAMLTFFLVYGGLQYQEQTS